MLKPPAWSTSVALVALLVLAAVPPAWGGHSGNSPAPDLEVTAVVASPAALRPGDNPTFTATVRNAGDAAAGNFTVRFTLDGTLSLGDMPFRGTLAPGGTVQITSRAWWNSTATAGNHTLAITADVRGSVVEHRETNNLALYPFVVSAAAPRPDLVVQGVVTEPPGVNPGTTPRFVATVANLGDAPAGDFSVRFTGDDGTWLGNIPFRGVLAPNATATLRSLATWNVTLGDHGVEVRADPFGSVPEREEGNNVRQHAFRAGYADLWIVEHNVVGGDVLAGDRPHFRAVVKNDGDVTARIVQVRFSVHGPQGTAHDEVVTGSGALAPGQSVEVRTAGTWVAQPPGDYELITFVDPHGKVEEGSDSSERYNLREYGFFTVRAPDFAVEAFTLEPPNPIVGEEATLTVRLANLGDAPGTLAEADLHLRDVARLALPAPTLQPGERIDLVARWIATLPAQQTALFWANSSVPEHRFDNNGGRIDFEVLVPDPAVATLAIRSSTLVAGVPHYLGPYLVEVGVGNLGTAALQRDVTVEVTACAKNPPLALQPPCEVAATLTGGVGQAPGVAATLQGEWTAFGNLGDFTFCARLDYPAAQLDLENDLGCVDGAVLVGLGGRGVRLLA